MTFIKGHPQYNTGRTHFKKDYVPWNKGKTKKDFPQMANSGAPKGGTNSLRGRKLFHLRGKNASGWRGGVSRELYPTDFNKELKELIRKRDGYKCQLCGCPQEECMRRLHVHHIDYAKDNIDPRNLISLCHTCHSSTVTKKTYWKKYFLGK